MKIKHKLDARCIFKCTVIAARKAIKGKLGENHRYNQVDENVYCDV